MWCSLRIEKMLMCGCNLSAVLMHWLDLWNSLHRLLLFDDFSPSDGTILEGLVHGTELVGMDHQGWAQRHTSHVFLEYDFLAFWSVEIGGMSITHSQHPGLLYSHCEGWNLRERVNSSSFGWIMTDSVTVTSKVTKTIIQSPQCFSQTLKF